MLRRACPERTIAPVVDRTAAGSGPVAASALPGPLLAVLPVAVLLLAAPGCADDPDPPASVPTPVPATASVAPSFTQADAARTARTLCPTLWDYVKAVGASFNAAADDVAAIAAPVERRERWTAAFAEMDAHLEVLERRLPGGSGEALLDGLVEQVRADLPRARAELDDIRRLFADRPELDEERHQIRTQQVVVRVEKVIELPKPDLAPLDPDGVARPEFTAVPACQHSVRDANDGVPRANG